MAEASARVCVYSQRGVQKHVSRCPGYEFEDVIAEVDDVDLVVGAPTRFYQTARKFSNRLARHAGVSPPFSGMHVSELEKRYDLFFAYFASPSDISSITALRGWRERCDVAVCWLDEIWEANTRAAAPQLKRLREFDAVVLNYAGSVAAVQDVIGQPCHYLPFGVDAMSYCPYPDRPARCVDIYSLGRRVPETHEALLEHAEQEGSLYLYDTVRVSDTDVWKEHRRLTADIARRSKFFVAYPAKFDQPMETRNQVEIGSRYFEGAAAGAAVLGSAPRSAQWRTHFDWPDAVIEFPSDAADLGEWFRMLEKDSERLDSAQVLGVTNSLRRHDWAHRWSYVLRVAGLEARRKLDQRIERLDELAELAAR